MGFYSLCYHISVTAKVELVFLYRKIVVKIVSLHSMHFILLLGYWNETQLLITVSILNSLHK